MSLRWRMLAAMVVFALLGTVYVVWALAALGNLYQFYAGHPISCDNGWRYSLNGCTVFHVWLSWFELLVATVIMAAVAGALLRWVQYPLRAMARSLSTFGPTNLAQRTDAGSGSEATRHLADAVNDMLGRLAEGYEAQRRFAASASHELRTPLATQRALVEVSLAEPLSPSQQALLGRQLLATNERNVTVIDGLLTLAEAERGLAVHEVVELAEVTAEAVTAARPEAHRRGLRLECRPGSLRVRGERALLERSVANLVHNALKYNVAGGWVCVEITGGVLRVDNSGPPVPAEQVDGLFEPFRRLAGDRLAGTDGAGLGLTIVRSIAQAHGGGVHATARPDGGLSVAVHLPPA